MEQAKHFELLLLITIRNNNKIPTDEFYKLFDDSWHIYSNRFRDLANEGLFMYSPLENMPGSYSFELTKKGKARIMELLNERSNAIDLKLVQLKNRRVYSKIQGPNIFRKILGFFTLSSARLTGKPSGEIELTVTGKGNSMSTY
jgi:hypothetical protein